ncbi:S-layer homology domain-containing protein [Paenibacillus ginsengarvi]|uniref:S-layer homology domain-containing protein n=1 Tax=Paenibacillus ginsengarvi TaxID=400777 RepID=A0A3B0CLZ0_9BACL|nr:S-layer homology domain-containing protein [Paenibacillus ginsengarvi]RKN85249.1 S-layer homology domain-containing protein [Paenibacillus ginsengarvi]
MKKVFKTCVLTTMTVAMLVGGAGSAFADKGKDRDDDKSNNKSSSQNWNNNGNNNGSNKGTNIKFENKGDVNFFFNFSDLKGTDVEWAVKYIASLSGKQVFQGFEDGTFRPREKVTRIQAIVAAVRNMGLEAQAQQEMNTKLNFKDADKIPDWAVGYVAVALENDLFFETESSVQPDKPADRLWATTLLVKSTKQYDAEVKANMNAKLPFKDAGQIPAGSVGYVKVALDHKLIDGFEDNTFRPNEPVTRAQLAALLDRVGDQLPGQEQNLASGTVTAYPNNNVLTITQNGKTVPVTVDPNAFVYRGGVRVALGALVPGDVVRVKLVNNVAIYVEVTSTTTNPNVDFTLNGRVYSYDIGSDEKITKIYVNTAANTNDQPILQTFEVAANYTIENGDRMSLINGRSITVSGTNRVVNKIKVNW